MLEAWKTAAVRSGLAQRVKFLGLIDDITDLLSAADLLVSPTRSDTWGLNVQEALCCGVPAIVTRCAGVAERYPAELRGLLIDNPDDDAALAEHILRWRADIEGWKRRIRPLQDKLRSRTWDDMAEEFVHVVHDAVSGSPRYVSSQSWAAGD
jgi:glycosyltransferase involved in cell wall biosynthesis